MDKKGPTPAVETGPKKDKNANPLLHNGVTNKDVRDVPRLTLSIDFPYPTFPL